MSNSARAVPVAKYDTSTSSDKVTVIVFFPLMFFFPLLFV